MAERASTVAQFWRDPGNLWRRIAAVVTLGAVVGFASGALANVFVGTFHWLNDLLLISPDSRAAQQDTRLITWATLAVPTAGGLIGGLLHWWVSDRQPHSPADLIAAVQTRRERMPLRDEILTGISSLVSLSFGASVGQYGPLVHVGGTLGSAFSRLL
ncbi:MAG TPA: chloride channel protein, partial [Wenzhouxiangella sp.]|nr:chloride channel protein [Wenzhouxiangella sp.]